MKSAPRTALATGWRAGALGALLLGGLCTRAIPQPAAAAALPAPAIAAAAVPKIELRRNAAGAWRFYVDGAEFPIRGAGGASAPGLLAQLKAAGGNCVRTWGIETLEQDVGGGERFIDCAQRLGIKVVAGIWIEHERHGFDYADPAMIAKQRARVVATVRKYQDHPAILAWGLGNEMEGPTSRAGSVPALKEVGELARLVKAADARHPVMSVIAFHPDKVAAVMQYCPELDILGVNSYGAAGGAGAALEVAGWTKPFAVTEFGIHGSWEVPTTPWGAPFEPNSQEKARTYYATHRLVFEMNAGKDLCLGTFAFLWGWKQERTATWYGMFLPTGEKLPQVDAMTRAWTGGWPSNRCPVIDRVVSPAAGRVVPPASPQTATVTVTDPEGDPLAFAWTLAAESTERSEGGDAEAAPPEFPELIPQPHAAACAFTSPATPGDYRLFLTVRDGRGSAATANFPFRVEAAAAAPSN